MRELLVVCFTSLVLGQASDLLSPGEFKKRLKSDKKLEPRALAWETECRITELAQAHNPEVNVICSAVQQGDSYHQSLFCNDKNGTTIARSQPSNSDEELLKWVISSECKGYNGAICLNLLDVQDRDSHVLERVRNDFLSLDLVRSSEHLYLLLGKLCTLQTHALRCTAIPPKKER